HQLKVGDLLDLQVQHIGRQSDHLTVREFGRTSATESTSDATSSSDSPNSVNAAGLPKAFHGFLGSLVGTLVDKDVEKGTFTVKVQAVPRVWKRNRAGNPKSIIGQEVVVEGLASRFLDVLLTTRKGETLEVAARHDGGAQLAFAGEMFRKVAPYQADDYPVLAEAFRGFQGNVTATIVKKDPMLYGLIVKIESVGESREGNRAKQAESMVGKTAILAGFWQRKEQFAGLQVGDRIQTGAKHEVAGSDVLMAVETLRKLGAE
ncbi:MAG: hypothetical protein KDB14_31555, partial [Planctomycetales bacterium]|nr:hypothetical protein [Planctomycetales bacterium]